MRRLLIALCAGVFGLIISAPVFAQPRSAALPTGVPLPPDVRIVAPSSATTPAAAAFSGQWVGTWDSSLDHILVVEEITENGARVIYAYGDSARWGIRRSFSRFTGWFEDAAHTLTMTLRNGARVTYGMRPDGALDATWSRAGETSRTVMTKVRETNSEGPRLAISVLEPQRGLLIDREEANFKVAIASARRLRSVKFTGGETSQEVTFAPGVAIPGTRVWSAEKVIKLSEGENTITVEALDEAGGHAVETVVVKRETLIAVELRAPAGSEVRVNETKYTVGPNGSLAVRLRPGNYQIDAVKAGFKPLRETVTVTAAQPSIVRELALTPIDPRPPSIVVLEPKATELIRDKETKLKLEIKSPHRLASLRIDAGQLSPPGTSAQTLRPDIQARAGEPWIVEATVSLREGNNRILVRAEDEYGRTTDQTLTITRQSFITLELRGPPGAQVLLNKDLHTLDASGRIALTLPPGPYELQASKEGFTPSREGLTLRPGQAPLEHQLALAPLPPPPPPAPPQAIVAAPPGDTEAPRIVINYPPADSKTDREQIVILGLVTDNVTIDRVQVTVNGIDVAQGRYIAVTGRGQPIRAPTTLQPGENVIEVVAADKAGNVTQLVRTVTRVVPAVASVPAPRVGNRWAVVIGIGDYENPAIPKLRYAARDAEAIYQVLVGPGAFKKEDVLLLTDRTAQRPTLRNIKSALGTFLGRSAQKNDTVLIFFAGHGAPEIDPRGLERDGLAKYLIPSDADPNDLYATALSMDEIQTVFGRIEAERMVMFVDACYSGAAGGRTFASNRLRTRDIAVDDQFLDRLTRAKGRAIVTASRPSEVSIELPELGHGLFTYYLIEGLKGAADLNRDGVVTLQELYEYVEAQVSRKSRAVGGNQHPVMKGELEGPLPLVSIKPR